MLYTLIVNLFIQSVIVKLTNLTKVGDFMAKKYPNNPPVNIGEVYERRCDHCNGNGQEPGLQDLTCRECIGRGRRKWRIVECKTCKGSGRSSKFFGFTKCDDCDKRGWRMIDIG